MVFDIVSVIHLPRKPRSENCSHWRFRRFLCFHAASRSASASGRPHVHIHFNTLLWLLLSKRQRRKDVREKHLFGQLWTPWFSGILLFSNLCCLGSCAAVAILKQMLANNCYETFDRSVFFDLGPRTIPPTISVKGQPGAVKLVLWRHWMHATQVHPVMSENQFHCTRLYLSPTAERLNRW